MTTAKPASVFTGVLPAITTPFRNDDSVDHRELARLVERMIEAGCRGIITPGSLGEGSSLTSDEKRAIWETCVRSTSAPVIAAIASGSTRDAVEQAHAAAKAGCRGLMVLPPYVYRGDWPETREHMTAIVAATDLPCMLYNNPAAYGVDLMAHHVAELAAKNANIGAVKDSSGDARRFAAMRSALGGASGPSLTLCVGMDDCVVEGVRMGATGWVAGLVNALPRESVRLFDLAMAERSAADRAATDRLYEWFLPLLRLDTVPKFVQLIKLVQAETETGSERVRRPRRELEGNERAAAIATIRAALAHRPTLASH